MCDRDDCGESHAKTCVPPFEKKATPLLVDVHQDTHGILSIYSLDGIVFRPTLTTTLKNVIDMIICTDKVTILTDRNTLVWFTFGRVPTPMPTRFEEDFTFVGPSIGFTFQRKSTHKVCSDGMYRTTAPTVLPPHSSYHVGRCR